MKVTIDYNERYPVFSVGDEGGDYTEVPEDTVSRWKKVCSEWEKVQDEMSDYLKKRGL